MLSHLPLSDFEGGLVRKLCFHIFHFHFLEGGLARRLRFYIFHFRILREVSRESFVFTSSTCTFFGGRSRAKASFSHLQLSVLEEGLARKLRFHIFHFQILREVLRESFVFTSATFTFWREVSHEGFVFTSSTFRFSCVFTSSALSF